MACAGRRQARAATPPAARGHTPATAVAAVARKAVCVVMTVGLLATVVPDACAPALLTIDSDTAAAAAPALDAVASTWHAAGAAADGYHGRELEKGVLGLFRGLPTALVMLWWGGSSKRSSSGRPRRRRRATQRRLRWRQRRPSSRPS